MIFFQTLTVRGPSTGSILIEKIWGTGLIRKKTEALFPELNERAEAATSSYSVIGDFLQYFYSMLVTKNYQNARSRFLVHEFSFTYIIPPKNAVSVSAL